MIVKTSSAIVADDSTRPGTSGRAASGLRDAGTATAAPAGAIATKMLPQLKWASSQPPTIGPSAMATPATAPHRPIARARSRRSVKTLVSRESVAGKAIAAPRPITARAAISQPALVVNPPARLAAPTTARPASSMPLRPKRSDRLPKVRISAAKTRLGVDDPLQLGRGGVQLPRQGGQRDVHKGRVEVDEESREEKRDEDQGLTSHSSDPQGSSLKSQLDRRKNQARRWSDDSL